MKVSELIKKLESVKDQELEVMIDITPFDSENIVMAPVMAADETESVSDGEQFLLLSNSVYTDETIHNQVNSNIIPE